MNRRPEGQLGLPRLTTAGPLVEEKPGDNIVFGERLNIDERIKNSADRVSDVLSKRRDNLDERLTQVPIESDNPNISPNTMAGGVVYMSILAINDYAPVNVGAEASIHEVEEMGDKNRYVINIDSPIESMAKFVAMYHAGTGASSIWLDDFDFNRVQKVEARPVRDSWEVDLEVESRQ